MINLNITPTGLLTANFFVEGTSASPTGNSTVGNLTVNGTSNLGDIGNVSITGGTPGQVLTTDGTGNLTFTSVSGTGTVTEVTGNGSGLGFSLGGTVTGSGNITLTAPTDIDLRTSLNIGNVANVNLDGNVSNVLRGDGTWAPDSGGGGSGTVTSVSTSGSGLGFSLTGGPITTTGTVTLNIPTDTNLRTSLNIGNVANTNYNGNGLEFLAGNGAWLPAGGGSSTSISNGNSSVSTFDLFGVEISANGFIVAGFNGDNDGTNRNANFSGTLRVVNSGATASGAVDFTQAANVSLGAVGNVSITGGTSGQVLTTDGSGILSWSSAGGGSGTVTSVTGNGSGLGFSLSGTVTTTGNITLLAPSDTDLRTSLNIGNVSNLNLDGNVSNVLAGDGTWVQNITNPAGNNTEVQFNDGGVFGSSSNMIYDKTISRLSLSSDAVPLFTTRYRNSSIIIPYIPVASRGTKTSPLPVQVNDQVGISFAVYSGNGTITVDGTTGFVNGGAIWNRIDVLPTAAGRVPSSSLNFLVSEESSNTFSSAMILESDKTANLRGNLSVFGNSTLQGNLTVQGGLQSIVYATENVGLVSGITGTYNVDLITNSYTYHTGNQTANLTLNIRGNSTVQANTILSTGQSTVATFICTTGATAYGVTAVQVDGSAQTIKWVGGSAPTLSANSINAYTFTVIKSASTPTYTVLGSMTRYA